MRPPARTTAWIALALAAVSGCRTADTCSPCAGPCEPACGPVSGNVPYGPAPAPAPLSGPSACSPYQCSRYAPSVGYAPPSGPMYGANHGPVGAPAMGYEQPGPIQPVGACCATDCGPACGPGCAPGCGPGCLPRELDKITLPTYVIEPPDILLIEAVNNLRPAGTPVRAGDPLLIRVSRAIPVDANDDPVSAQFKTINDIYVVRADGTVDLGPEYGRVPVAGYDVHGAREAIRQFLVTGPLRDPLVSVQLAEPRTRQHVSGEHLVRQDGTVSMGIYGGVHIAGLTIAQARRKIECHLSRYILEPEVSVDVLAYNSKVYYVVTDGAGAGEQVYRFPCTGNETVLDALAQINGLPIVACKKHIWVARPAPAGHHQQRLAVDWDAIVRGGSTDTNYQVLPGDRIYVRADKMVTFDTMFAKVLSPFERVAGFALLSNGTYRAVQYGHRGGGFGGGGFGGGNNGF